MLACSGSAVFFAGSAGFFAGSTRRSVPGADGAAAAGAPLGRDWTTDWQPSERSALLALRQSRISGLVGCNQEQCAIRSLMVQAFWTDLS
jgi:hypothetical protein